MKLPELLFFAVAGWAGIGAIGTVLSVARGRRSEAIKHTAWLAGVLSLYLVLLLTVSILQPQKLVPMGQDQCFDEMCFAVVNFEEVPPLAAAVEAGDAGRVIQVTLRVANRGRSAHSEGLIRAYLIDSKGRTWEPLPGLSGNRLSTRVAAGSQMLSQPMYRVAKDSAALSLVLTRGHWQPGRLVIGDSDSLAHRPAAVPLHLLPQAR